MANYSLCVQLTTAMCMMHLYMFLSYVIPGPHNPKTKIDVYLQPVIDDLKTLWNEGVDTYDVHTNQTFKMKAALMWTVNDFLAYRMLSRWSTYGGCHVQFVKISYEAHTYSIEEKCIGLIVIIVFSQKTMHSRRIGTLLLRKEQWMDSLHSA